MIALLAVLAFLAAGYVMHTAYITDIRYWRQRAINAEAEVEWHGGDR